MMQHWFWLLLMLACIIWYSTVTFYIAFKGAGDIKHMLRRLAGINAEAEAESAAAEKREDQPRGTGR